jgi:hypothetical protein
VRPPEPQLDSGACLAHRRVPPLFVATAEVLAADGEVDRALPLLRRVTSDVRAYPPDVVRHAERALLRIVRRMRLRDEREGSSGSLAESLDPADRALLLVLDGLDGPKSQEPPPPVPATVADAPARLAWLHALWVTFYAPAHVGTRARQALSWAHSLLLPAAAAPPDATDDFVRPSLLLDVGEVDLLAVAVRTARPPEELRRAADAFDALAWWEQHQDRPAEALRLHLRAAALGRSGASAAVPGALVARLGIRAAAEIALDEGERLALRLPDRAPPLLARSREWFARGDDRVGALLAAGARTLCYAAAASDSLSEALDEAGSVYAALRAERQGLGLPSWDLLEQLAAAPEEPALDGLEPRGWRPWLIRLIGCLALARQARAPVSSTARAELLRWVQLRYGRSAGDALALPADFAGWLEALAAAPDRVGADRADSAGSVREDEVADADPVALAPLVQIVTGHLTVGEIADLARSLDLSTLEGPIASRSTGTPATSTELAHLADLLVQELSRRGRLWELGPALSRLRPDLLWDEWRGNDRPVRFAASPLAPEGRPSGLVLRVFPAEVPPPDPIRPTDVAPVRVSLTVQHAAPAPAGQTVAAPTTGLVVAATGHTPGLAPYHQAVQALPSTLRDLLRSLDPLDPLDPLQVVVEPTSDLHGPPWDALAALAADRGARLPRDLPFRFVRRVASARPPRPTSHSAPARVVAWAPAGTAVRMALRGWEQLRSSRGFDVDVRTDEAIWDIGSARESVQVLHLIGVGEESYGQPRFRILDESDRRVNVGQRSIASGADDSFLEERSARLVKAEDVEVAFPSLALCVVQGPPGRLTPQRLDGDRYDAALARAFAADLSLHGVPLVVVLPSLEPRLAIEALAPVAGAVELGLGTRTAPFLEALSQTQTLIVEAMVGRASYEEASEWAFDVCLYAAGGGDSSA